MDEKSNEMNDLRFYLLGKLELENLERIEEGLFSDPEFFIQLELAEQDLVEEYLSGESELTEKEWAFFLRSPETLGTVRFIRSVKRYDAEHTSEMGYKESWFSMGDLGRAFAALRRMFSMRYVVSR